VIELRFHRELYDGNAVHEAMKVFGAHATLEPAEEPSHWIIRVTGEGAAREKRVAGELANYALGLTITRAGADAQSKSREAQ
jgi:hypothetical protein